MGPTRSSLPGRGDRLQTRVIVFAMNVDVFQIS